MIVKSRRKTIMTYRPKLAGCNFKHIYRHSYIGLKMASRILALFISLQNSLLWKNIRALQGGNNNISRSSQQFEELHYRVPAEDTTINSFARWQHAFQAIIVTIRGQLKQWSGCKLRSRLRLHGGTWHMFYQFTTAVQVSPQSIHDPSAMHSRWQTTQRKPFFGRTFAKAAAEAAAAAAAHVDDEPLWGSTRAGAATWRLGATYRVCSRYCSWSSCPALASRHSVRQLCRTTRQAFWNDRIGLLSGTEVCT
jgi:hypothetical protein